MVQLFFVRLVMIQLLKIRLPVVALLVVWSLRLIVVWLCVMCIRTSTTTIDARLILPWLLVIQKLDVLSADRSNFARKFVYLRTDAISFDWLTDPTLTTGTISRRTVESLCFCLLHCDDWLSSCYYYFKNTWPCIHHSWSCYTQLSSC